VFKNLICAQIHAQLVVFEALKISELTAD